MVAERYLSLLTYVYVDLPKVKTVGFQDGNGKFTTKISHKWEH